MVAGRYYLIKILGYLRLSAIWFIIYFKDIPIMVKFEKTYVFVNYFTTHVDNFTDKLKIKQ